MTPPADQSATQRRYVFHCVAPEVYGGPMPTDDLDEALLATASWVGLHWDIWDTVEHKYVQPIGSEEEEAEVRERFAASHALDQEQNDG